MRITFGSSLEEGARAIALAAEQLADAQRQVSSGRRINAPSDDPSGTAIAITERATMARLDTYTGTSDAAMSRLTVADSVMSDIITQLSAAKSSALSGRGSTQTAAQRAAISSELLSIRDAVLSDINTKFRGTYLFGGSTADVEPYTKAVNGTISAYQGNGSPISVDVGEGRAVATSFDGGAILKGGASQHVLDVLTNLAAAVQSGDNDAIGQGLTELDAAFDRATTAQSGIGNSLRLVDDGRAEIATAHQAALTRTSKVEDADMAAAIASMSKADTAYRAALGAFANSGRLSLMDYIK